MQLGQATQRHPGGGGDLSSSQNVNQNFQMVRGQDESKLPVSWLAGNTGEHATSVDALWALRDFMLQEALGVVKIM